MVNRFVMVKNKSYSNETALLKSRVISIITPFDSWETGMSTFRTLAKKFQKCLS